MVLSSFKLTDGQKEMLKEVLLVTAAGTLAGKLAFKNTSGAASVGLMCGLFSAIDPVSQHVFQMANREYEKVNKGIPYPIKVIYTNTLTTLLTCITLSILNYNNRLSKNSFELLDPILVYYPIKCVLSLSQTLFKKISGCINKIKSLQVKKMSNDGWIKVEDRLPHSKCLVHVLNSGKPTKGWYERDTNCWYTHKKTQGDPKTLQKWRMNWVDKWKEIDGNSILHQINLQREEKKKAG